MRGTYRTSSSWVLPKDLDSMVMAWHVLFGPNTGLPVKWDSRVMRLARRHRSSMDSARLGDGLGGAAAVVGDGPAGSADMAESVPGMR
jgi:hypothetical protein